MEIAARKRNKNNVERKKDAEEISNLDSEIARTGTLEEHIAVRINATLYGILTNYIISAHTAMDYKYQSVSDVIRMALQKFKDGMHVTEIDEKKEGEMIISTTIRIGHELKIFWESLPDRNRRKILERAIRTYLKEIS